MNAPGGKKNPPKVRTASLPKTCGKAYGLLVGYFKTDSLASLSQVTGISRSTLAYWKSCPDARMRQKGLQHLQRIFSGPTAAAGLLQRQSKSPDVVALLEVFQQIKDTLSRIEQRLLRIYS